MDKYLEKFKAWFLERKLREKILATALTWAFMYAVFAILFFNSLDAKNTDLAGALKVARDQSSNWVLQLKYLNEIPASPIYKEWVNEHNYYLSLKNKYEKLLGKNGSAKWDDIIKTILSSFPNITIDKIENTPETIYETSKTQPTPDLIYQQQMRINVIGGFSDVVAYLTSLENAMPNIQWDTLVYTVSDYPSANIAMEFSILYEKSKNSQTIN